MERAPLVLKYNAVMIPYHSHYLLPPVMQFMAQVKGFRVSTANVDRM
jgi:hypothetical protein